MRRTVGWIGLAVVGLLLLAGLLVLAVAVTTPGPRPAEGWVRLADMPEPRGEVAIAVAERPEGPRLFVMGGITGLGRTVRTVSAYDPEDDAWTSGPDLPAARNHAAAAALGGAVYVSGGSRAAVGMEPERDFWVLEPGAERWEPLAELPEARSGHGMVAWNGRLYVVGGAGPSARVLIYEPDAGWSVGSPLPRQRDHLSVLVVGDAIWAIGGRPGMTEPLDRVDVYDPAADSWTSGPPLPEPMSATAAGVLSTGIHVVGGEDPRLRGGIIDRHYRLPPGAEHWVLAARPIAAVHGVPGAVWDDALIIPGGSTRHGFLSVLGWTGVTQAYRQGIEGGPR